MRLSHNNISPHTQSDLHSRPAPHATRVRCRENAGRFPNYTGPVMDETTTETPLIQLANATTPSIIKVIGVGGGGGNAVGQMYLDNIPEVRYLVANTDSKALADSPVPDHLQMGPGLGAGGNPVKGREQALDSIEKIDAALDPATKMVFITAGMGGGTGTGASPVIAHEARKKGILTIGIVTIPFLFEREKQIDKALDGLDTLSEEVDAMLVINNQRLCDIYPDLSIINAFKRADETLSTAVSSITEIISMHGRVNLDFCDVQTALTDGGVAVMSTGYAEGEGRVTKAIREALNSPLLNNNDVFKASRVLLAITTSDHNDQALGMSEMGEVTEFMSHFAPDVWTKWGLAFDPTLEEKVKITIIASGFSLYGKEDKTDSAEAVTIDFDSDAALRKQDRRRGFYPDDATSRQRPRPRVYLFSDADLRNPEVLRSVEDVPTYRRTGQQLKEIRDLSDTK